MPVKYLIKIEYTTGDSFKSEDTCSHLELEWENIDVAQANLKRIEEHYKMYGELTGYSVKNKKREDVVKENINKDWFVNHPKLFCISTNMAIDEKQKSKVGDGNWEYRPDSYYYEYCIKLKTDEGKDWQISCFWCGHFESLISAEIELDKTNMKIEF